MHVTGGKNRGDVTLINGGIETKYGEADKISDTKAKAFEVSSYRDMTISYA